jgi:uncharacterized protein YcnI
MNMRKWITTTGAALALVVLGALPVFAHVTVNPGEASSGFQTLTFQVPHGCEGSPTVSLTVQIPPGVASVKPQVKPGWEIVIEEGELAEPVEIHGETVTEGVIVVTWEGGSLPDEFMDQFRLSVFISGEEGETVYFPVIQECAEGEHRWIQIPEEGESGHELPEPAPAVVLIAAGGGHGGGDDGDPASEAEEGAELSAQLTELRTQVEALETTEGASNASAEGTDPLVVAALIVGGLGLVFGGAALAVARRR